MPFINCLCLLWLKERCLKPWMLCSIITRASSMAAFTSFCNSAKKRWKWSVEAILGASLEELLDLQQSLHRCEAKRPPKKEANSIGLFGHGKDDKDILTSTMNKAGGFWIWWTTEKGLRDLGIDLFGFFILNSAVNLSLRHLYLIYMLGLGLLSFVFLDFEIHMNDNKIVVLEWKVYFAN